MDIFRQKLGAGLRKGGKEVSNCITLGRRLMEVNRECYGKAEGHITQLGHEDGERGASKGS